MMRRGDGIGIEVLPDALRGVRLQQDAPGRVAKVAGVACDTNNDLLLLDGLTRLRSLLDEDGHPTRACLWSPNCHIQSLDITGWSTTELNLHRSKLVDVSATIEMSSSARRLLAHLQTDMIRHRRVERFIRQAGFDLDSIEPTPIAVARLVPAYTMRLIGSRGDAQPWLAVVHDRVILAAAPAIEIGDMTRTELMAAGWSAAIEDLRERLLSPAELSTTINQPAGIAVSLGLSLVGDTYPEFPDTHPAWGPRLAGALGAAVAAAGLAGRVHQVQPLVAPHAFSDDGGVWVIERIGDVAPAIVNPTPRRRWRRSPTGVMG
ncbi:MAG TPA: hypothetical protein VHN36_02290 [Ilumatobacteraceae bacterium]|nr:hypothetical protein [Ilumatobacteraceae bacterium]